MSNSKILLLSALFLVLSSQFLFSSSTKKWTLATKEDFDKGQFKNLVLNTKGEIQLGIMSEKVSSQEISYWSGIVTSNDKIYLGSGSGKLLELVTQNHQIIIKEIMKIEELLITSFIEAKNKVIYFATIPNGNVYKISESGKVDKFCTLPDKYVWKLIENADGALLAVTGPQGKLYKITPDAQFSVVFDPKKGNVLSLALSNAGEIYFGTANPGILYYIDKTGKANVVYDFGDAEVKDIVLLKDTIYVAINSSPKLSPPEFLNAIRDPSKKEETQPATSQPQPPQINSSVYKLNKMGVIEQVFNLSKAYITTLYEMNGESLIVTTNNSGKVYKIAQDGSFAVIADLDENQVLNVLTKKGREVYGFLTGDAASVYIIKSDTPVTGEYISDVFDAKYSAQWGSFYWEGDGKISFQFRTSNISTVDETWSNWSNLQSGNDFKVDAENSRYIQFKAVWDGTDKNAKLRYVTLKYRTTNQRPKITSLTFQQPPQPHTVPQSSGLTSTISTAQVASETPTTPLRQIVWQASDPDNDQLTFQIFYKKTGTNSWLLLTKDFPVAGNQLIWNTSSVPDGRYQIKIVASDSTSNPEPEVLTDEFVSNPIIIDNGKPDIINLKVSPTYIVTGTAKDNVSDINRIEYKIDDGEWQSIYPNDNLYDSSSEDFTIALDKLEKGNHVIIIRAFDTEKNVGSTQLEFLVQ